MYTLKRINTMKLYEEYFAIDFIINEDKREYSLFLVDGEVFLYVFMREAFFSEYEKMDDVIKEIIQIINEEN